MSASKLEKAVSRLLERELKREPRTGRAHARAQLALLQRNWGEIRCVSHKDHTEILQHGYGVVARIEWSRLRRALPLTDFIELRNSISILEEQSEVAAWAVRVATEAFAAQSARKSAGRSTKPALKDEAAKRSERIKGEAAKIKAVNRQISRRSIARILSERGMGGAEALRKRLK